MRFTRYADRLESDQRNDDKVNGTHTHRHWHPDSADLSRTTVFLAPVVTLITTNELGNMDAKKTLKEKRNQLDGVFPMDKAVIDGTVQ